MLRFQMICVLGLLLVSCDESQSPVPDARERGTPHIAFPRPTEVICDESPPEFVITELDASRDAAIVYLVGYKLFRVPLQDDADTLRFHPVWYTAPGRSYEAVVGVEYVDGAVRFLDTVRVQWIPDVPLHIGTGTKEYDYSAVDLDFDIIDRSSTREGTVRYDVAKVTSPLGGKTDWFRLTRDYEPHDWDDTLRFWLDEDDNVSIYDLQTFIRNDLFPDTANADISAEWIDREEAEWLEIARVRSAEYCRFPSRISYQVLDPAQNVLRLALRDGPAMELPVIVYGMFRDTRLASDSLYQHSFELRVYFALPNEWLHFANYYLTFKESGLPLPLSRRPGGYIDELSLRAYDKVD
ncbi:hypothetical protein KQI65_09705 [bacterium]|nr:hypothetical protein [bacterium]